MESDKGPKEQEVRALTLLAGALGATHHAKSGGAAYDVDRDRVVVTVLGIEIAAFGPKEWFMTDDELSQMLRAAILNEFGQGNAPFREPEV